MRQYCIRTKFTMFCWLLLGFCSVLFSQPNVTIKYKVLGIKDPALSNVINRLTIAQKQWLKSDQQNLTQNLRNSIPEAVQQALTPFGYYHATVQTQLNQENPRHIMATLAINLGPAMRVQQVTINVVGPGAKLPDLQTYIKKFPLQQGDILNTVEYEKAKKALFTITYNHGYLGANYRKSQILVDRKNNQAQIQLLLDTGPQYYFGAVNFKQSLFDPNFLQRYVQFKPGEPYSTAKVMALNKDLNSSNYFSDVSIHPQEKKSKNYRVPIDVNLTPSKAQKYTIGLGYGTDTGPRGQLGINLRHLTRTGQHFQAFLQASRIESTLNAHYYFPGKNPISDQSYLGASLETQSPNTSEGRTAALNYGYQTLWGQWKTTLSLGYQYDHYSIRGLPYRNTHLLLPQLSLLRSHVDNILFPRKGYQLNLELRGASQALGSTSFIQSIFGGKWIFSPSQNSRLLVRAKLGISGVGDPERIPLSLQLFAGGSQSIRGYGYKSLGPGKYLYVGSMEFQHKLYKNWWGTVFVDTGNSVNNLAHPEQDLIGRPDKLENLHKTDIAKVGAGVGIMYVSPIGPIELTVANPITDRDQGWAVQFTMGANL